MTKSNDIEIVSQFLLAEFNSLQETARDYEKIKSNRVNFYLLIIAAAGAIFSTISNIKFLESYLVESSILICLLILILGLLTLKTLSDYSISIVVFYRKTGRIRKWFISQNPDIEKYVGFGASDDIPKFIIDNHLIHWRGGETILLFLNCLSFSLISIILMFEIINLHILILIILSFILGCFFWFIQVKYINRKMKKVENSEYVKKQVNFPSII